MIMHYRLLDIQRQKVDNPLIIRSIITIYYNVNKETQRKLFKTVVSYSETQVNAFKTIFGQGLIVKEEDVSGALRRIEEFENKLLRKRTYIWHDDTTITLYHYNADNLLVKSTEYKKNKELSDSNVNEETTYEYNSNNDRIKYKTVEDPFHWILSHTKYTIDSKWEYETHMVNGECNRVKTCYSESTYTYRDSSRNRGESEHQKYKEIYIYDKNDNLINYTKYDDKGNIVEMEKNKYHNNLLIRRSMEGGKEEIRQYNEHEDVIFHKRYQTRTIIRNEVTTEYVLVIRNMEYKYDRYGNWIECRCYDENGDYSELFTRQIEYTE